MKVINASHATPVMRKVAYTACVLLLGFAAATAAAGDQPAAHRVLPEAEWDRIDAALQRAVTWIVAQQQRDGSFETVAHGQPGITSLCTMALLSQGHLAGEGPYGKHLDRALDFILASQRSNGLVARHAHDGPLERRAMDHEIGVSAVYNHAISSLLLTEVYAMAPGEKSQQIELVVNRALAATLAHQQWEKPRPVDTGGWRYLHPFMNREADLSIAGWQLKFLRSAKNAGFNVPQGAIDQAVGYVLRCFNPRFGVFEYTAQTEDQRSRGMAGAGILALAHSGMHHRSEAVRSAEWILQHPFNEYNHILTFSQPGHYKDRYHYGVFLCTRAMYQMGGRYWQEFYPATARTLLAHQNRDGSWPVDSHYAESQYGRTYSTALVVLALSAPNQLLPIYQR